MKTIKTQETKIKVNFLAALIEFRRAIDETEREIKAEVKKIMGTDKEVVFDDYIVSLKPVTRRDFDREHLEKYLGDKIKDFEKITEFEVMSVSKKKGARR